MELQQGFKWSVIFTEHVSRKKKYKFLSETIYIDLMSANINQRNHSREFYNKTEPYVGNGVARFERIIVCQLDPFLSTFNWSWENGWNLLRDEVFLSVLYLNLACLNKMS